MCDALNFLGMSCPLKQGPGTLNVTQTIPELGLSVSACCYMWCNLMYCTLQRPIRTVCRVQLPVTNATQSISFIQIQVHGNVKATDQDNEEILCVDLDFKLEE